MSGAWWWKKKKSCEGELGGIAEGVLVVERLAGWLGDCFSMVVAYSVLFIENRKR